MSIFRFDTRDDTHQLPAPIQPYEPSLPSSLLRSVVFPTGVLLDGPPPPSYQRGSKCLAILSPTPELDAGVEEDISDFHLRLTPSRQSNPKSNGGAVHFEGIPSPPRRQTKKCTKKPSDLQRWVPTNQVGDSETVRVIHGFGHRRHHFRSS